MPNPDPRYYRRGYAYALLGAVCGGIVPTLSKLVAVSGPLEVSALIALLGGGFLIPYKAKVVPRRNDLFLLVPIGILGAAVGPFLYITGIRDTTAVNASLLVNGELFFTSIIAFAAFRETLKRIQLLMGLLVVAGIVVVSTNLDLSSVQLTSGLSGNILIIASTFLFGIENNLSRIASQRLGPVLVTKYRNLIGGVVLLAVMVGISAPLTVSLAALPFVLGLAVANAAAVLFTISALRRIGAVRTLLVFSTSSIFGSIFALVFLKEQITPVQILGGAFMLSGIYLIQRSEDRP
ncbi:MAG: DMT family transporter [Thaumarchaeota archaeon]|nr:DMT family transporter [Nitrososphaerota archaeon]